MEKIQILTKLVIVAGAIIILGVVMIEFGNKKN